MWEQPETDNLGEWAQAFRRHHDAAVYWRLLTGEARRLWGDAVVADPTSGTLTLGDRTTVSIHNVAAAAASEPVELWPPSIRSFLQRVDSIDPSGLTSFVRSWDRVCHLLRVRLWPAGTPYRGLSRPITENVQTVVVLAHRQGVIPVSAEHLRSWKASEQDVWTLAFDNTRTAVRPRAFVGQTAGHPVLSFGGGLCTTGLALDLSDLPVAIGNHGSLVCAPTSFQLLVVPLSQPEFARQLSALLLDLALPLFTERRHRLSLDQLWYQTAGVLGALAIWDGEKMQNAAPPPMSGWLGADG